MMKPTVSVIKKVQDSKNLQARLKDISRKAVYVGIPDAHTLEREAQLTKMINLLSANTSKGRTKRAKFASEAARAIAQNLNNAELLYIFSKGSPANNQPPRPVLEPAVVAKGNKEAIAYELAESSKAVLNGKPEEALRRLRRAGIAAENASKKWFTDSRNGWAPNAPMTIALKGSDRPGINTGAMRQAITSVVKDEP